MMRLKSLLKKTIPERYTPHMRKIYHALICLRFSGDSRKVKYKSELTYWKKRKAIEGSLSNDNYEFFYTTHFGIEKTFFNRKRILDIGCGPRGSLEWADMASERIGLDPLAYAFHELGTDSHKMQYMAASSEHIPFPDGYFDVVCSFNSLDHVDDLDQTIREIIRIIKPGGLFLLLTEVNHDPTPTEPIEFSWDVVERFTRNLKLIEEKHYEKSADGMYQSIKAGISYDHSNRSRRYAILSAKFMKAG